MTDDGLLAFESSCGSNNICLDGKANDQILLCQTLELVRDDRKENDSKDGGKCGEGVISEFSNQSLDKEFACNENDACVQDSDGYDGVRYNGETYKKKLHFEGDNEINDNASKGLGDNS